MRFNAVILLLLSVLVFVLACSQSPESRAVDPAPPVSVDATKGELEMCIGQTARDVVQRLGLQNAEWFWTDEPPAILRGVSYHPDKSKEVIICIAESEPLFRKFDEKRKWDYEEFLRCRVGGIQYRSGEVHFDIGPAVPFQFRRGEN